MKRKAARTSLAKREEMAPFYVGISSQMYLGFLAFVFVGLPFVLVMTTPDDVFARWPTVRVFCESFESIMPFLKRASDLAWIHSNGDVYVATKCALLSVWLLVVLLCTVYPLRRSFVEYVAKDDPDGRGIGLGMFFFLILLFFIGFYLYRNQIDFYRLGLKKTVLRITLTSRLGFFVEHVIEACAYCLLLFYIAFLRAHLAANRLKG